MNTKYEPSAFDDTWKDEFGAIYTFDKKKLIKGVNVPRYIINDDTTIICDHAFDSCDELTEIEFPNSLCAIGCSAFFQCSSLRTIDFPESLLEIGDGAFSCCISLESVVLPVYLNDIGKYAFSGCI